MLYFNPDYNFIKLHFGRPCIALGISAVCLLLMLELKIYIKLDQIKSTDNTVSHKIEWNISLLEHTSLGCVDLLAEGKLPDVWI